MAGGESDEAGAVGEVALDGDDVGCTSAATGGGGRLQPTASDIAIAIMDVGTAARDTARRYTELAGRSVDARREQ